MEAEPKTVLAKYYHCVCNYLLDLTTTTLKLKKQDACGIVDRTYQLSANIYSVISVANKGFCLEEPTGSILDNYL